MTIIELLQLEKSYGDRKILEIPELKMEEKEKIGIVGANGSGKSTLLEIIAGKIEQDKGFVKINGEIGYFKQFNDLEDIPSYLSGGEKTQQLIKEHLNWKLPILLVDEPTNHLDMDNVKKLENNLKRYEGTLLIISHDRELLDNVCSSIIEIEKGRIKKYNGNYTCYQKQKKAELERMETEYQQYSRKKKQVEKSIQIVANEASSMKKAPSRMGNSEARLHKREAMEKQEKVQGSKQALLTRLNKLEVKEKPSHQTNIYMKSQENLQIRAKTAISAETLNLKRGNKVLLENASFRIEANHKTALIGKNGSGKTTLIEEIIAQSSQEIKVNGQLKIAYFSQELNQLMPDKTIMENVYKDSRIGERELFNLLGRLLLKPKDIQKKIEVLSGGERVRVCFAKLLASNSNMLVLDEPTNFLDIPSIEALQSLLQEYSGTVLFTSHDRKLIDEVAEYLLIIENKKIVNFQGNYSQYLEQQEKHKAIIVKKEDDLLKEFKKSELISRISFEKNEKKKLELIEEYEELLRE